MFVKITLAIALVLATASGALAAPKQKHNTSRADLSDTRGQHGGSAARAKAAYGKTTHAKRTHVRTAQKQRHRTSMVDGYDKNPCRYRYSHVVAATQRTGNGRRARGGAALV